MALNSSNELELHGDSPLALSAGRIYPMELTFQGSFDLWGVRSIRVYAVVGNVVVAFDSMNSYFPSGKKIVDAVVSAASVCASRYVVSTSLITVAAGHYFTFSVILRDQFSNPVKGLTKYPVLISSNSSWRQPHDSFQRLFAAKCGSRIFED